MAFLRKLFIFASTACLLFVVFYRGENGPWPLLQNRRFLLGLVSVLGILLNVFHVHFSFEFLLILIAFLILVVLRAFEGQMPFANLMTRFSTDDDEHIAKIVKIIQQMPIEEFKAPEEYESCSISELLAMLRIRQQTEHLIEKAHVIEALKKCRQYNDTCCICCEEYETGDPLRILKKCKHEFHVECIDQWSYTQRSKEPTCPLCKSTLLA